MLAGVLSQLGAATTVGALFIVNWIVNISFMADIVVNFFLPYRESQKKGGALIKSHGRIARNYLTGWFLIDFVSSIPIDFIILVSLGDGVLLCRSPDKVRACFTDLDCG